MLRLVLTDEGDADGLVRALADQRFDVELRPFEEDDPPSPDAPEAQR